MRRLMLSGVSIITLAAVALGGPLMGLSDDQMPKSTTARGVLLRLADAKDKASDAYAAAVKAATGNAVTELEKLKASTMKSGAANSLDEANRIQSAIDALNAASPATADFRPGAYNYDSKRMIAKLDFTSRGEVLDKGKPFGGGKWTAGPDGSIVISGGDDSCRLVPFSEGVYVGRWNDGGAILLTRAK